MGQYDSPNLCISMCTQRELGRLLSSTSKHSEDRSRSFASLLAHKNLIDHLETKAFDGVVLEIGSGRLVFRILVAPNPTEGSLAFIGGAAEKMASAAIVLLHLDVGLEKPIDCRTPAEFGVLYMIMLVPKLVRS